MQQRVCRRVAAVCRSHVLFARTSVQKAWVFCTPMSCLCGQPRTLALSERGPQMRSSSVRRLVVY
jgi:hypothetical protein